MGNAAKRLEAVHYPESDNVGEHELQRFIAELLRPLLAAWLRRQMRVARASADTFFYFVEGDPKRSRAPDVYVIDGVSQDVAEVGSWKTWEGHRPAFALEVVSDDYKKDYREAPADYDAMGATELVIFDPGATAKHRKRVRWQVYRRVAERGFVCVETSMGDRVRSEWLGAWLRVVDDQGHVRLRLGYGTNGDELLPTDAEVAATERAIRGVAEAQAEAERAVRRAAEEQARAAEAAKRVLEAELTAAREELARLRRGG